MAEKRGVELGKRIKEAIKQSEYSQQSLAKKLGISNNALSNYANGKRIPDATLIPEIAKLCKVDPLWLLTGQRIQMPRFSIKEAFGADALSRYNEGEKEVIKSDLELLQDRVLELERRVKELEQRFPPVGGVSGGG